MFVITCCTFAIKSPYSFVRRSHLIKRETLNVFMNMEAVPTTKLHRDRRETGEVHGENGTKEYEERGMRLKLIYMNNENKNLRVRRVWGEREGGGSRNGCLTLSFIRGSRSFTKGKRVSQWGDDVEKWYPYCKGKKWKFPHLCEDFSKIRRWLIASWRSVRDFVCFQQSTIKFGSGDRAKFNNSDIEGCKSGLTS